MTETHYEIRVDRGEARTELVDYETDLDDAETFYYDLRRLLFRYVKNIRGDILLGVTLIKVSDEPKMSEILKSVYFCKHNGIVH